MDPVNLDGPDERLTPDQYATFKLDMDENPGRVRLLGFNDGGWLCYEIDGKAVAVAPSGDPYIGRDAHWRRHEEVE